MKRSLQVISIVLLLGTVFTWLFTGANRGWTKTSVAVKTLDDVTGIEGISYENKFLPGLDFLGGGSLAALALGGTSLFFRKPKHSTKLN